MTKYKNKISNEHVVKINDYEREYIITLLDIYQGKFDSYNNYLILYNIYENTKENIAKMLNQEYHQSLIVSKEIYDFIMHKRYIDLGVIKEEN